MRVNISPYIRFSFEEYISRTGVNRQIVYNSIAINNKGLDNTFDSIDNVSEELFWEWTIKTTKKYISDKFELFRLIIEKAEIHDFSPIHKFGPLFYSMSKQFIDDWDKIEINLNVGWGKSTNVTLTQKSRFHFEISYDFHFSFGLKELAKYLFSIIYNEHETIRNEEELDVFYFNPSRYGFGLASYIVGVEDNVYYSSPKSEMLNYTSHLAENCAFQYIIFHELAHILLNNNDIRFNKEIETEQVCDYFAAVICSLDIKHNNLEELDYISGITCLYFFQYSIDIYHSDNLNLSQNYISTAERYQHFLIAMQQFSTTWIESLVAMYSNYLNWGYTDYLELTKLLYRGPDPATFKGIAFNATKINGKLYFLKSNYERYFKDRIESIVYDPTKFIFKERS